MKIEEIREHLEKLIGCVTFEYYGYSCGIDPLECDKFEMWYGNKEMTASSIEEVMSVKFFDGNSLEEIVDDIIYLEW